MNEGQELAIVERVLAGVEACLRETFPDDFYRRCAFSALAIRTLLREAGIDAVLVGGQFAALVATPDLQRLALRSFHDGREPQPHYWVESLDRLIDLGPHLLAFGSDYPAAAMPALAWHLNLPLPTAIRYNARERYPASNSMNPNQDLRVRAGTFIDKCRVTIGDAARPPRLPTWIATSYSSLFKAVARGDPWALAARRLEQMPEKATAPF